MYFEAAKNITLAIACHSTGADKEALVYSVVAVLCIVGMCAELAISAEITVAGRKGITNIEVINEGGSNTKTYMTGKDGELEFANINNTVLQRLKEL